MQTQKSRIGNLAIALFVMTLPCPHLVEAQQPGKIPRIGFLGPRSAFQIGDSTNAFRQGLSEFGYIEGKNIVIEYRWAEENSKADRFNDSAECAGKGGQSAQVILTLLTRGTIDGCVVSRLLKQAGCTPARSYFAELTIGETS